MNVSTIIVSREEAERKLQQYKNVIGKKRVAEDDKLQSLYAAVSKGARVLNLASAFKQAGVNESGQPKLAVARADFPAITFSPNVGPSDWGLSAVEGGGVFYVPPFDNRATLRRVALPGGTFNGLRGGRISSPVPHVPPAVRPRHGLHNYHILFEVREWKSYPVDPFLLRRIMGMLFVVEAEWELTELEASLLSAMTAGN